MSGVLVREVEVVPGLRLAGRTWTLTASWEPSEFTEAAQRWRMELSNDKVVGVNLEVPADVVADRGSIYRLHWDRMIMALLQEVYR